jgi:hypothetical protein
MTDTHIDWKKKYEELEAKYQDALKRIEALQKQLETVKKQKVIELGYEQKSIIDAFLREYLGDRPSFGGGAALRWDLFEKLIKALLDEKEGDYVEFLRRFARKQGLTERKLDYGYMKPLIEDGVIEVFYGNKGLKWRWAGGEIWRRILKEAGKQSEEKEGSSQ